MNRILLAGASGRLGQEITSAALAKNAALTPLSRAELKNVLSLLEDLKQKSNEKIIIVDVSLPEGTETIADSLLRAKDLNHLAAVVIGTTGHSRELTQKLTNVSQATSVVVSSNFSRGVYLTEEMLRAKTSCGKSVAELARELGFDLALWESHHVLKKDAPSGTAKTLAQAAGIPNDRIASTRVGAVVGEHTLFLSQGAEELRLTHMAHSRRLFADGAVDLCERVFNHALQKKLYTMSEALNQLMQAD
ncbi:MAG: hypothetical protein FJY29_13030 [Betaproteobacteria bacterium]|nr:hypothetical protein [Betaproteobacteria bacterium]